jgi:NTP pyrophosphatase (non-canonical NTP hydrolase)
MRLDRDDLTIRDAQAFHEHLDQEKHFDTDMLRNVAYLTSEVGEVVMAVREFKNAEHATAEARARAHMGEELADCLAYLLKLANYADVDLQAAYVEKMQRNLTRTWRRFETE